MREALLARQSYTHRLGRLLGPGLLAVLVAMAGVTLVATLLEAVGVDFEVDGGEIPVAGFATVTGVLSIVGVVIAGGLLRWSRRPAERFVATGVTLTAISLVPPVLWGRGVATVAGLVLLHLVVAAIMVPALARVLRRLSDPT